jgi:hypothetical protein
LAEPSEEPSAGLGIYHPHLHGLLTDGYWIDGVFTRFTEKFWTRVITPVILKRAVKKAQVLKSTEASLHNQDPGLPYETSE